MNDHDDGSMMGWDGMGWDDVDLSTYLYTDFSYLTETKAFPQSAHIEAFLNNVYSMEDQKIVAGQAPRWNDPLLCKVIPRTEPCIHLVVKKTVQPPRHHELQAAFFG